MLPGLRHAGNPRQLAFETPRSIPWTSIRAGSRLEGRFPVVVRDARSYARWPTARLLRLAGLATIAGLSLAAMWQGTTALIGVVGVALYLAAIEVIGEIDDALSMLNKRVASFGPENLAR